MTVNDPTCGAGATLIGAVNHLEDISINFQNHALFIGQDLDYVACMMCYIQLSLLGCAGWIIHGNTLTNENPIDIYYMPMFFLSDIWVYRTAFRAVQRAIAHVSAEIDVVHDDGYAQAPSRTLAEDTVGQLSLF